MSRSLSLASLAVFLLRLPLRELARRCDRCRRRCRRPQPSPSPGNGARPPPTSGLPGERNAAPLFKSPGGRRGAAGDRGPPIVLGEMDVVFPPPARQQRRHPRDPPPRDPIFCPRAGRESRPAGGGSGAAAAAVVVVVVVASLEAAAAEASPSLEGAAAATTAEDRVPFHDTPHQVVSPPKERPAATTAFFKGGAEWSTRSFSERGDHLVDGEGRTGMVGLDGWLRFATAAAMLCCALCCE